MAISLKQKKQSNILPVFITAILLCAVFITMVGSFFAQAEDNAYEMLHLQTRQIKDDLTLQLKSDRENLVTMANFASMLYSGGESYDLMFESFKPIGLFSNIGILNPDNSFVTKAGKLDLSGKISFEEEAARGEYISGRVPDLTRGEKEIIRSAVPIKVNGETVGILYGVIKLDVIGGKYTALAKDLEAQLFVYDKETGKFVIDTIDDDPGELSNFKTREYNKGYSYEQLLNNDRGYSSFKSIFTGEDLYIHYSTLEDFNWGIMLARYETQVFAEAHIMFRKLLTAFIATLLILGIYMQIALKSERERTRLQAQASAVRKLLLSTTEHYANITEAMRKIREYSGARSAFFADTDGEYYYCISDSQKELLLTGEDRSFFNAELFRYAANFRSAGRSSLGFMHLSPNSELEKTNPELRQFLIKHAIRDVSFAIIIDKNNYISIIGTVNPKKPVAAKELVGDVAVCFSIAIFNKKHLSKTELAATTDGLTGALNRVAYKRDIIDFDEEQPEDFASIYVDVNELHLRNNKYGHAAGDEMLIFIANTLKELFFGHCIYRMGGDEFLVFARNISPETVKDNIERLMEQLKPTGYNVAIGTSYRSRLTDCEEMVRESEVRMYEAKARYYQSKQHDSVAQDKDRSYVCAQTGIREIDTMISVLKEHYNGIYRVSLGSDRAHRILMPSYLGYREDEENFSGLLRKYINDSVEPEYRRAMMSFANYEAIKRQMAEDTVPSITYRKVNGETVTLSVYGLNSECAAAEDTLWVFSRV